MSKALGLFRDAMMLLMTKAPLHASVATQLKPEVSKTLDAPGATDGCRRIIFSERHLFEGVDDAPPFIDPDASMTEQINAMAALVAHECEHVLRLANTRIRPLVDSALAKDVLPDRGRRESMVHMLFNIAQDFVINASVLNMGLPLPGQALSLEDVKQALLGSLGDAHQRSSTYLYDPSLEGRSEEDIVNELLAFMQRNPQCIDSASDVLWMLGLDDHTQLGHDEIDETVRQQVVQRAAQAVHMMKGRGYIPAEFRSLIEHGVPVRRIPWRKLLARAMQEVLAGQPDWTTERGNRWLQTVGSPVLGFGEVAFGVKRLGFAIDTSGSMELDELKTAVSALRDLLRVAPPEEVVVVHCDSKVQHEETIRFGRFRPDTMKQLHGGGGTAFEPALSKLRQRGVDMAVYVTDGFGDDPPPPPFPVIWLTTGPYLSASFGKQIELEV